ncbi:MAG: hypothetical protein RBT75_20200, partial [Anaerolineae bacterium]|nr:hypothetical protein [Anaerolineae bacterium]
MMIQLDNFSGEIPKLPAHLLPDGAAQTAINCDFAHGELRPIKGLGTPIATAQAVRSLFTDDGLRFFSWDAPTRAFLGPTIEDAHDRVYYANPAGFRVTQASQMRQAAMGPMEPTASWLVGIKSPDQALQAELIQSPTWRTDPAAVLGIKLYYETDGRIAGPVTVTGTTEVTKWREYLLTISASTPAPTGVPSVTPVVGTGAATISSGTAFVYTETGTSTINISSGSTLTSAGELKVGGLSYSLVVFITYQGVQWDPRELYAQLAAGTVTAGDTNGTVGNTTITAAMVAEVYVYNPSNNFRYFTAYTGNSAQNSTGRVSATITGEQVSATQFRVKISYDPIETIAYSTTVVNDWGEESRASKPVVVDVDPAQQVRLKLPYTGRAGERSLAGINVYRTYASNQSSDLFLATP